MSDNKANPIGPIPLFVKGSTSTAFSSSRMNQLVRAINRLQRLKIKRGNSDSVFLSDADITLQLATQAASVAAPSSSSAPVLMVVTGISGADSWTTVDANGKAYTVLKPPSLRGSVSGGNVDTYTTAGVHSLLAVSYAYNSDYSQRTASASGFFQEVQYMIPAAQPLVTVGISGFGSSPPVLTLQTASALSLIVGQAVQLWNLNGFANGTWVGVYGIQSPTQFAIASSVNPAGSSGPTLQYGGTIIYAAQDSNGNWFDLNVDGRQWSQVPVTPVP